MTLLSWPQKGTSEVSCGIAQASPSTIQYCTVTSRVHRDLCSALRQHVRLCTRGSIWGGLSYLLWTQGVVVWTVQGEGLNQALCVCRCAFQWRDRPVPYGVYTHTRTIIPTQREPHSEQLFTYVTLKEDEWRNFQNIKSHHRILRERRGWRLEEESRWSKDTTSHKYSTLCGSAHTQWGHTSSEDLALLSWLQLALYIIDHLHKQCHIIYCRLSRENNFWIDRQ